MAAMLAATLGKTICTYFSFVSKVLCTKYGAERPTSYFSQDRPFAMAAILVAFSKEKLKKSCSPMQWYCVPNLVTTDLTV